MWQVRPQSVRLLGGGNENINNNNTERNPHFNGECKNCDKRGHRDADCWEKKVKQKDDDVDNLFLGAKLCGEVQEENDKEDTEEWLCDSGASSHVTHKKKDLTKVKKAKSMSWWEMVRR